MPLAEIHWWALPGSMLVAALLYLIILATVDQRGLVAAVLATLALATGALWAFNI